MEQPKFLGVFVSNPHGFRGLISIKLGAAGRLDLNGSTSKSVTSACCGTRGEAAAARDLLCLWAQRQYEQHGPAPGEALNFPAQRYSSWPGLMDGLAACRTTAEVQALLKHLRDEGTLAGLAGTQASTAPHAAAQPAPVAAAPGQAPSMPAEAATLRATAAPAAPTPARAPRHGSGSRELQRLLQSQQEEEAALLHEDLFTLASSGQPAGVAERKRTRQQRQQARPPPESAGLSLLLLRGDSQALGSLQQSAEDGAPGEDGQAEEEEEWASPQRRQRRRSSQGGQGAAAQQQPQPALPQPALLHTRHVEEEAEALAGLLCLATSPTAAEAAAAAGRTPFRSSSGTPGGSSAPFTAAARAGVPHQQSLLPARAAERKQPGQAVVPAAPHTMAGRPTTSPTASAGSGRSSSEQWGHTAEGNGPAGAAVDVSSWHVQQAGHGPVVQSSSVRQPAAAHEQERQRQQRLLSLLGACIQRALAKQEQERRQGSSQEQPGGMAEHSGAPALPSYSSNSRAGSFEAEEDGPSAAAAAHPESLLATAQGLLLAASPIAATPLPAAATCTAFLAQQQAQLEMQQRLAAALLLYQQQHSLGAAAALLEQQVEAEQQGGVEEQQAAAAGSPAAATCPQVYSAPRLHLPLVQVQVPVQLVSCRPGPVPPSLIVRPAVHTPLCRAASAPAHQQQGSQPPSPAAAQPMPPPPPPPPRQLPPERLALLRSRSLFPQPPITTGHWHMRKGNAKGTPGASGTGAASKPAPR